MAVSAEGASSTPAVSDFHTAFPTTTLFHTHTHPFAPHALSCSPAHVVALLTPSLITFQPLSNLAPPASFPPSTASSLALPLPATTAFPTLTFSAPPHVPHPTASDPPPSASHLRTSATRRLRATHLDVDGRPAQPPPNHFLRGKWASVDVADGSSLYGVVMTRGNTHLIRVSANSALCPARSLCELSSLLVEQHKANESAADEDSTDSVEQWLTRLRSVTITAIAFSTTTFSSTLLSLPLSSTSHPAPALLIAVGAKDGRVSLFGLQVPVGQSATAVVPVCLGSSVASTEYITELSFAPTTTYASSAASAPCTLHLAVGDSCGVTAVWQLTVGDGSMKAAPLHTFKASVAHVPVSILTWHRPPPLSAAGRSVDTDSECSACNVAERCVASHVVLAAAVASSVSIHFFDLPSFAVISSYPLPAVHKLHISSLVLLSSPACPLPVLLSSSASSATYRHLLTSTTAMNHSHYHSPTILSPLPSRYGLSMTADGLLLIGCDVRMADTKSLKKRDGVYITSVKAWPIGSLQGSAAEKHDVVTVATDVRKRKRKLGGSAKQQKETDEQKAARWTRQHRLLDEFSTLCDAVNETSAPRCHFTLCLHLTARLSPLSHLLACAMSEPPSFNPHSTTAHIRFMDALTAWLDVQLPAVWSASPPWSAIAQSRMRTLHFLAMFALRCTSGDCQFVEATSEERARVLQCRDQLEAVMVTRHFTTRLSSASPATQSLIIEARTRLAPLLPPGLSALSPQSDGDNSASAVMAERCFVCNAAMPYESLRWAECSNGHRWCRDADRLCAMPGVKYVECVQCEGRAECVDPSGSGDGGASGCCWMCGTVRVLVEV